MVLTCSYRRICKACPSCSLVLLAIAFSIYIRVINRLLYQRRGLMFDVSDPIFRFMKIIIHRLIKSVSYSVFKVWTIHIRYVFLTFCTSSALRNLFLDAHHMQSMSFIHWKSLRAAPSLRTPASLNETHKSSCSLWLAWLFCSYRFAFQMCVRFYMRACKTPARLKGLFQ